MCFNSQLCQLWERSSGGPRVNKFEQVSSLDYQMSVGGDRALYRGGRAGVLHKGEGRGVLNNEVQCITENGHMGTPMRRDRQT